MMWYEKMLQQSETSRLPKILHRGRFLLEAPTQASPAVTCDPCRIASLNNSRVVVVELRASEPARAGLPAPEDAGKRGEERRRLWTIWSAQQLSFCFHLWINVVAIATALLTGSRARWSCEVRRRRLSGRFPHQKVKHNLHQYGNRLVPHHHGNHGRLSTALTCPPTTTTTPATDHVILTLARGAAACSSL